MGRSGGPCTSCMRSSVCRPLARQVHQKQMSSIRACTAQPASRPSLPQHAAGSCPPTELHLQHCVHSDKPMAEVTSLEQPSVESTFWLPGRHWLAGQGYTGTLSVVYTSCLTSPKAPRGRSDCLSENPGQSLVEAVPCSLGAHRMAMCKGAAHCNRHMPLRLSV